MTTNNEQMLYVHIPFCSRKCYYCGFVSVDDKSLHENYFKTLSNEIFLRKNNIPVSSIYFGGGTPGLVNIKYLRQCLEIIKKNYLLNSDCEITFEANPTKQTAERLQEYKDMGFNRVSFGIQSLDQNKLLQLGRLQNSNDAIECVKKACSVFDNVSVDLLLGLQNQSSDEIIDDIDILYNVGVKHFSLYMLMVEEGTRLYQMVQEGKYFPMQDDCAVEVYQSALKYLQSKGIFRYEISNFAKPNFCCKHNLGYWQMKNYLGFGAAAHSFVKNIRFSNSEDVLEYTNNNKISTEILSEQEIEEEKIMLGLRTVYGVDEKIIKNKTQLETLIQSGYVLRDKNNIVIADDYFGVANQIILKLI